MTSTRYAGPTELTTSQADDLALLAKLDLTLDVDSEVSKEVLRDDDDPGSDGDEALKATLMSLKDMALADVPSAELLVAVRDAATKALNLWERSRQARDYYKTQYRRVSQEKNGLVDNMKKLRAHVNMCRPAVDDLKVRCLPSSPSPASSFDRTISSTPLPSAGAVRSPAEEGIIGPHGARQTQGAGALVGRGRGVGPRQLGQGEEARRSARGQQNRRRGRVPRR